MRTLRALIVDDEPLARESVAMLLREEPEIEVIGECADGRSALAEIRRQRPDLVFLDVQMPVLSGLELLEQLEQEHRPTIVFITAYDQHAVRAFELCAVDYLLKPFRDQRFKAAVARAKERARSADYGELQRQAAELIAHLRRLQDAPGADGPREADGRVMLRVGRDRVFLEPATIAWIEAQGDRVKVRAGDRVLLARESLQNLERRLDPARFVRVHRSFVVNPAHISKITPAPYGDHVVLTRDGAHLRLSRTYRGQLKRLLHLSAGS